MMQEGAPRNVFTMTVAGEEGNWTPRHSHSVVHIQGHLLLLGGFEEEHGSQNDVWLSKDGKNWTEKLSAPWSGRDGHRALVKGSNVYVIGGAGKYQEDMQVMNDVWHSDDCGTSWSIISKHSEWCGRWQHGAACLNDSLIVIGGWGDQNGYLSDVWSSRDGKEWTLLCAVAPFGPRAMHSVVVHENVMYVIGGFNGDTCMGDVWASTNGKRWSRICHSAPWLPRHGHSVCSCQGYLYLFGGVGGGVGEESLNDVWRSHDGSLWELVFVDAPWPPRNNHSVVVTGASLTSSTKVDTTKSKDFFAHETIVLLGGVDKLDTTESNNPQSVFRNDVWAFNIASKKKQGSQSQPVSEQELFHRQALSNTMDDNSGLNISMQAVSKSVIDLYRERQELASLVENNEKLVEIVNQAASVSLSSGVHSEFEPPLPPPSPTSSGTPDRRMRNSSIGSMGSSGNIRRKASREDFLPSSVSYESDLGDLAEFQDAMETSDSEGYTLPQTSPQISRRKHMSRSNEGSSVGGASSSSNGPRKDGEEMKREWWWWLGGGSWSNENDSKPLSNPGGGIQEEGEGRHSSSSRASLDFNDNETKKISLESVAEIDTSDDLLSDKNDIDASTATVSKNTAISRDLSEEGASSSFPSNTPPFPHSFPSSSFTSNSLFELNPSSSISDRIRLERKELRNIQDQIFKSALEAGSMISESDEDDNLGGGAHHYNRSRTQSEEGMALEALLIQRHSFAVAALLRVEEDLKTLKSKSTKPQSWLERIRVAKVHIERAMRESKFENENNPITRLRQQHSNTYGKKRDAHLMPSGLYPDYPTEEGAEEEEGDDGLAASGEDDGVGPWSECDKSSLNTMSSLTFHEAVNEIKGLTSAPLQPDSLRNASDDAIRRLRECLDLRARAAHGMLPSYSPHHRMDGEAAAEALAWAQLWDSSEVLTNLKLQVNTAVGLELKKIPVVREQALNLKSKLLPASLSYLEILENEINDKVIGENKAEHELGSWKTHLEQLVDLSLVAKRTISGNSNQSKSSQTSFDDGTSAFDDGSIVSTSCNKLRELVESKVQKLEVLYQEIAALEDDEIDARSAFEKAFRRRKSPSTNMMLRSNSSRLMSVSGGRSGGGSSELSSSSLSMMGNRMPSSSSFMKQSSSEDSSLASMVSKDIFCANVTDPSHGFISRTASRSSSSESGYANSQNNGVDNNASKPSTSPHHRLVRGGSNIEFGSSHQSEYGNSNEAILLHLQDNLSRIVGRTSIVKRRLRRILTRAARIARILAPELVAYVPALIDTQTKKLKLVQSTSSTDIHQDLNEQSELSNKSSAKRGPGGLPWVSISSYSQIENYVPAAMVPLSISRASQRTGSDGEKTSKDSFTKPSSRMFQRQLSSGAIDALNKSLHTTRTSESVNASSRAQTMHSNRGETSANSDQVSNRLGKFRPSSVKTNGVKQERNEWLLSAVRDGQRVLLKGYGARRFSSHPFGGGRSKFVTETKSKEDGFTSDYDSDMSYGVGIGGYDANEAISQSNNRNRSATEDFEESDEESEDEEEFELERLLGMPPHAAVAGPMAIIDATEELSPTIEASFDSLHQGGIHQSFASSIEGGTTTPLFYLELPYPHPGNTLVDWVLYPGSRSGADSSSASSGTPPPPPPPPSSSQNAISPNTLLRQTPRTTAKIIRKENGGKAREERSPWELQHMARHILAILAAMHGSGRSHGALHPTAVEVDSSSERVRVKILPTCLLRFSREYLAPELMSSETNRFSSSRKDDSPDINQRVWGTSNGLHVLRNSGQLKKSSGGGGGKSSGSGFAADMYAFGVLLHWMHLPEAPPPIPGALNLPAFLDVNLKALLTSLLSVDPSKRPSASDAILHPYLTASFSDRLVASGELLHQDEKLEAVRSLIKKVRYDHRDAKESITVHRNFDGSIAPPSSPKSPNQSDKKTSSSTSADSVHNYKRIVNDVLQHFESVGKARNRLKVTFHGEAGVDEGALCTEMFRLFFEGLMLPEVGMFECSEGSGDGTTSVGGRYYLPKQGKLSEKEWLSFKAVGRVIVKCFYEGKRLGSRFAPSFFKYLAHGKEFKHAKKLEPRALDDLKIFDPEMGSSLEWMLATSGVDDLGLDFDELPDHESCSVTDLNKAEFVKQKVRYILMESRSDSLEAVREGFWQFMLDLSPEATPFLKLLSTTDWSLLLCGEDNLSAKAVISVLKFNGYPPSSKIPHWLPQSIEQFSPDNLRRFLIFCTGSPSLPSSINTTASSSKFEINVQYVAGAQALPVAHTCFYKLDLPSYNDQTVFVDKLTKAIQECGTFDRV